MTVVVVRRMGNSATRTRAIPRPYCGRFGCHEERAHVHPDNFAASLAALDPPPTATELLRSPQALAVSRPTIPQARVVAPFWRRLRAAWRVWRSRLTVEVAAAANRVVARSYPGRPPPPATSLPGNGEKQSR